jgi:uncharacterized protein YqjF (DUF2071 family)
VADWLDVVMIHFEVNPVALQKETPFPIDLYEGRAFVSAVAFTMRRMRPYVGGRWTEWWFRPIATHEFLNVRTYVRERGESGICFLAEWIPNRISFHLGGPLFGLPYRLGRLDYQQPFAKAPVDFAGTVTGVKDRGAFRYHGGTRRRSVAPYAECEAGSLDEWLMERYTAFTCRNGVARRFQVWHPPWQQTRVKVEVVDASLLTDVWPWFGESHLVGANASPGFQDVWMGRPAHMECGA